MFYNVKVTVNSKEFCHFTVEAENELEAHRYVTKQLDPIAEYQIHKRNGSVIESKIIPSVKDGIDMDILTDPNRISKIVKSGNEKIFYNSSDNIIHKIKYKVYSEEYETHCINGIDIDFEEFYTYNFRGRLVHYKNSTGFECRYRYTDYGGLLLYRNSNSVIIVFDFDTDGHFFMEVHSLSGIKNINTNPFKGNYASIFDVLNNPDKVNKLIEGDEIL